MTAVSSNILVSESPLQSLYDATVRFWTAFTPFAPLVELQQKVDRAVRIAQGTEDAGIKLYPENTKYSFGVEQTIIDGHTIPVKVSFNPIQSSCDLWEFSCPHIPNRPKNLIVVPNSGGRATIVKSVVEALLPYMDIAVAGWTDPHLRKKNNHFDMDNQTDCILECCVRLGSTGKGPIDAITGISQSGAAVAIAIGAMGAEPSTYRQFTPRKVILEVAPINTRLDRNGKNWVLGYFPLPEKMFIPVGLKYEGKDREILPYEVMQAHYQHLSRSKFRGENEGQSLAREHFEQMIGRIYQRNLLGRNEYRYRDREIDLSKFDGDLLTVVVQDDDLVSPDETNDAHRLFSNVRKHDTLCLQPPKGEEWGHYAPIEEGPALTKTVARTVAFIQKPPQPV